MKYYDELPQMAFLNLVWHSWMKAHLPLRQ